MAALVIEDDGPGVPEDKLSAIVERGLRLDETRAGSGLGLAIAGDIAEVYGVPMVPFDPTSVALAFASGCPPSLPPIDRFPPREAAQQRGADRLAVGDDGVFAVHVGE